MSTSPADQPDRFRVTGIGTWFYDAGDGPKLVNGDKLKETLATLVAAGPQGIRRDELFEVFFRGKRIEDEVKANLRVRISRVRRILPDAIPSAESSGRYELSLRPDQVDLWKLLELADDTEQPITENHLEWALAGEPFAGVDLAPEVGQAYYAAVRAQSVLVERFCRSEPKSISFKVCEGLLRWSARDPYDEATAMLVAETLVGADRLDAAVDGLRQFIDRFESELSFLPTEAEALLERLLRLERDSAPPGPGVTDTGDGFPPELSRLRTRGCVGRDAEIETLVAGRGGLILGARGSGKSQLLSEIAKRELAAGNEVTYLAGQEDVSVDLGPFLAALPELGPVLGSIQGVDDPAADTADRVLISAIWSATLRLLEPTAGVARRHLLVDDAQWLDRRSAAIVNLLAQSSPSRPLVVTVAGRSEDQEPEWARLQQRLTARSLDRVELGALNLEALRTLVGDVHQDTTDQARRGLALDVLALSGGLPMAARTIIDKIDPVSLTIPEHIGADDDLVWVLDELDPNVRRVGLAAAVLGLGFSQDALVAICEGEESETLEALDVLVRTGFVHLDDRVHGPGNNFSFDHVLKQQAFLTPKRALPFETRKLYLAAARYTDDVHARARYLTRAGRPHEGTVDALTASARQYFEQGQWWAAAKQLRQAERLGRAELTTDDYVRFATSLDLSGQDGTAPRRRAFELAKSADDWTRALAAACSGLPSAERPDGDMSRLKLLDGIPAQLLADSDRFEHAQQLARHHSLNGDAATGLTWAEEALALATDEDRRGRAYLSLWTAHHHVSPEPYFFPDDVLASAIGTTRARLCQMQSISALESGDLKRAVELHEEFKLTAIELADPLRIWHAMTFDALLAFDRGNCQGSDQLAERAYRFGLLHDHQEATSVRAGQLFMLYFTAGREAELLPFFGGIPANIGRSALASASFALAQAAGSEDSRSKARELAVDLVHDALQRQRSSSVVVAGLLAPLIAESQDASLIAECRKYLLQFADRSIVVGFGVANMGPLWQYLAPLAESEIERREWLQQAVEASRQLGSPTWTAINLRKLADESGDDQYHDQARDLCQGTDIFWLPS